ncbi:MAG: hypothetical protein ACKOJC_10290 [Actinomycetota bacterium]
MNLVERIVAIAQALDDGEVEWAIGGAIALAYATAEPRATRDVDINVFVESSNVDRVFASLPEGVRYAAADRRSVLRDDQVRLWWDTTPIDLFFSTGEFHRDVATRCRSVPFANRQIRILSADDLAIFKALFDRPKDWVDIDEMDASGALDRGTAARRLASIIDPADLRVVRLLTGTAPS